jgi:hypothetical protein
MEQQIVRIAPHQTAKIVALITAFLTLISTPIGLMFVSRSLKLSKASVIFTFISPLLHGLLAYLFVAMACWLYNHISKKVGGILINVDD